MSNPDVTEKPSALLNLKTRSMALDLLAIGGYIPKPRLRQAIRIAKRALAQTPNIPS